MIIKTLHYFLWFTTAMLNSDAICFFFPHVCNFFSIYISGKLWDPVTKQDMSLSILCFRVSYHMSILTCRFCSFIFIWTVAFQLLYSHTHVTQFSPSYSFHIFLIWPLKIVTWFQYLKIYFWNFIFSPTLTLFYFTF